MWASSRFFDQAEACSSKGGNEFHVGEVAVSVSQVGGRGDQHHLDLTPCSLWACIADRLEPVNARNGSMLASLWSDPLGSCGDARARSVPAQDIHQVDRIGPTVKRQPPGIGSTSMLFSYSSHSSSATGSRLIARRTGSGTGAGGRGGGAVRDTAARATVARVDLRVRLAPQALQVRPPWLTVSQTPHRQMVFIGIDAPPAC